jgi:putative transposase
MPNNFYKRNLPHWQMPGATFFITWRLCDSLPRSALEQIEATRQLLERELGRAGETDEERKIRHFKKLFALYDGLLDKAEGGRPWLKDEKIAAVVEDTLLRRYANLYTLWAYVVMPNHVHVFLRPKLIAQTEVRATDDHCQEYVPLKKINQYLKGDSAREANVILGRTGHSFWQDESYDHWARDEDEFYRIIAYIENNPVKTGLAPLPEGWPWSSAAERNRRGYNEIRSLT